MCGFESVSTVEIARAIGGWSSDIIGSRNATFFGVSAGAGVVVDEGLSTGELDGMFCGTSRLR